MMKRLLIAVILMFVSASALFALDGIVTWTWYENDPNVEFYRYQLDGEEEGRWTVVDWSVTEVSLTLDVSVIHTLYLQQSYDGEIWGPSSATDSEIYTEGEEPEPYEEEELSEEEIPEESEWDDEVIAATVMEDEIFVPTVEVEVYRPQIYVDGGIGYVNSIPDSAAPKGIGLNGAYSRTFLKVGLFDIGVRANLGLYTSKSLFTDPSQCQISGYVNALAMATTVVGNCDVYGAIGPDLGFTFVTDGVVRYGLAAELGLRYHRYRNFSIGFALSDHYYVKPRAKMINRMELKAFLSWAL